MLAQLCVANQQVEIHLWDSATRKCLPCLPWIFQWIVQSRRISPNRDSKNAWTAVPGKLSPIPLEKAQFGWKISGIKIQLVFFQLEISRAKLHCFRCFHGKFWAFWGFSAYRWHGDSRQCGQLSQLQRVAQLANIGVKTPAIPSGYVKIAIENDHRNSGFSHWKWWFSIVMLVYQRVTSSCSVAEVLPQPENNPTPQIFIGVVTDLSMHNASLQPPKGAPEISERTYSRSLM